MQMSDSETLDSLGAHLKVMNAAREGKNNFRFINMNMLYTTIVYISAGSTQHITDKHEFKCSSSCIRNKKQIICRLEMFESQQAKEINLS